MFLVVKISYGRFLYYCGELNGKPMFLSEHDAAVYFNDFDLAFDVIDKYTGENLGLLDTSIFRKI